MILTFPLPILSHLSHLPLWVCLCSVCVCVCVSVCVFWMHVQRPEQNMCYIFFLCYSPSLRWLTSEFPRLMQPSPVFYLGSRDWNSSLHVWGDVLLTTSYFMIRGISLMELISRTLYLMKNVKYSKIEFRKSEIQDSSSTDDMILLNVFWITLLIDRSLRVGEM
jgi:hypothetical protein